MYPYFLSLLHFTSYPFVHHHLFNAAIVAAGVRITFCNTFLLSFIYSIYYNFIHPIPNSIRAAPSTFYFILFYSIEGKKDSICIILSFYTLTYLPSPPQTAVPVVAPSARAPAINVLVCLFQIKFILLCVTYVFPSPAFTSSNSEQLRMRIWMWMYIRRYS